MRLRVVTPVRIVAQADGVTSLRAEDDTGSFGIRPGHADFVTRLSVCVLGWTDADQEQHYVALRGGVMRVSGGDSVEIATVEAEASDVLQDLEGHLVQSFRLQDQQDERERVEASRLHSAAIHQIERVLRASRESTTSVEAPQVEPLGEAG